MKPFYFNYFKYYLRGGEVVYHTEDSLILFGKYGLEFWKDLGGRRAYIVSENIKEFIKINIEKKSYETDLSKIIQIEPEYVQWLILETDHFCMSNDLIYKINAPELMNDLTACNEQKITSAGKLLRSAFNWNEFLSFLATLKKTMERIDLDETYEEEAEDAQAESDYYDGIIDEMNWDAYTDGQYGSYYDNNGDPRGDIDPEYLGH